jgi:excisionase family DNA binding protein
VITIKEVAEYLKLAEKTAYRVEAEGKIPSFKVGASWRFRKSEIDRWIIAEEQGRARSMGNSN